MTLLERWAKAEPERVEDDGQYMTLVAGDYLHTLPRDITLDDPALLGFIVAAIEARGWQLEVLSLDHGYAGTVWADGMRYEADPYRTAAEALLSAYLDAVEGEG